MGFFIYVFTISLIAHAAGPVRVLLQENRLEEALPICRQFEALDTDDIDSYLACAWVFFRSDKEESAIKLMQKIRKPGDISEYQLLVAFEKMKARNYELALRILDDLYATNRNSAIGISAYELKAEVNEEKGDSLTAAFLYKQVVGDDPTRARAHWGLARHYLATGDMIRARTHLEKTAKLWPKHVGSRYNLGVLHLSQENSREAGRWLSEAYKLDRSNPNVLEQLGLLFEKKGNTKDAVRYWQKTLILRKDSTVAKEKLSLYLAQLVDSLIEAGEYDKAMAELETSGKNVSSSPELLLRRATIHLRKNRFEQAIKDYASYLSSNPKDVVALRDLGVCYLNTKDLPRAAEQFRLSIIEEPTNGINYAWMAFVYEAQKEWQPARDYWKKAVSLLRDPVEVGKARRKLATIESRIEDSASSEQ